MARPFQRSSGFRLPISRGERAGFLRLTHDCKTRVDLIESLATFAGPVISFAGYMFRRLWIRTACIAWVLSGVICFRFPGVSEWTVVREAVHVIEDAWPHMPTRRTLSLTRLAIYFDEPLYWRIPHRTIELVSESSTEDPVALLGVRVVCSDPDNSSVAGSGRSWAPLASGYSRIVELWPDEHDESVDGSEPAGHAFSDGASPHLLRLMLVSESDVGDDVALTDPLLALLCSGACALVVSPPPWLVRAEASAEDAFPARIITDAFGNPTVAHLPLARRAVAPSAAFAVGECSSDTSRIPRPSRLRTAVMAPPATQPCAVRFNLPLVDDRESYCSIDAGVAGGRDSFYSWAIRHVTEEKETEKRLRGSSRIDLELRVSSWLATDTPAAATRYFTKPGVSSANDDGTPDKVTLPHATSGFGEITGTSALLETQAQQNAPRRAQRRIRTPRGRHDGGVTEEHPPSPEDVVPRDSTQSRESTTSELQAAIRRSARSSVRAALGSFGGQDSDSHLPSSITGRAPTRPLRVTLMGGGPRSHYVDSDALSDYELSLMELDALPSAVARVVSAQAASSRAAEPVPHHSRVNDGVIGNPASTRASVLRRSAQRKRRNSAGTASENGGVARKESEAAVLLEAATTLRAALAARVPGLKKIIEPIVGMVLDPVTEQVGWNRGARYLLCSSHVLPCSPSSPVNPFDRGSDEGRNWRRRHGIRIG